MTVEEKAEEYADRCACLMEDIPIIERAYRNGAEFGYNKAKEELKAQIEKMKLCQNCKFADNDFMEEPCRNCSRCLGEDIKREGKSIDYETRLEYFHKAINFKYGFDKEVEFNDRYGKIRNK